MTLTTQGPLWQTAASLALAVAMAGCGCHHAKPSPVVQKAPVVTVAPVDACESGELNCPPPECYKPWVEGHTMGCYLTAKGKI